MTTIATVPSPFTLPPGARRPRRIVVIVVALLTVVAVTLPTLLGGTAAAATHGTAERSFVAKLNSERRARDLRRLTVDRQLTRVARAWSAKMVRRGTLAHNPRLASEVKGNWLRIGENVGMSNVGRSEAALVRRLHDAFMASPGHRANVLRNYNEVGVGVAVSAKGTLWVTVVFAHDGGARRSRR